MMVDLNKLAELVYNKYNNTDIVVTGDANTYYPVAIKFKRYNNAYDNELIIHRHLGEQCNSTYSGNHSNGTSSMHLSFLGRVSGWDGNAERVGITSFVMPYAPLCGRINLNHSSFGGFIIWLRGGGTLYHIKSDSELECRVCYTRTDLAYDPYSVFVEPITTVDNLDVMMEHGRTSRIMSISEIYTSYIKSSGNITGAKVYNAVWNDYAEFFPRGEITEPGDIIALDLDNETESYIKADESSKRVVGVHSDTFAHLIGGEEPQNNEDYYEYNLKKFIPIGLAGRVYVKVIGNLSKGDYIVPSSIKGVGRKYDPLKDEKDNIIGYLVESDNRSDLRRLKIYINKK